MSTRQISWALAFVLVAAVASAAWAQDADKPAQPEEAGQSEPVGVQLGAAYSLWITDLDFRSESPTEIIEYEGMSLMGVQVFGSTDIVEEWQIRLAGDFLFGVETDAIVGSLGVVYTPADLLEEPLTLSLRAAFLFGRLEMKDVAGDFDTGYGVEAGAGLNYGLDDVLEGLGIQVDLMLRYLKFSFSEDETALDADDGVGGFGVSLLAGLTYKF